MPVEVRSSEGLGVSPQVYADARVMKSLTAASSRETCSP